jgi:hypothetical protein
MVIERVLVAIKVQILNLVIVSLFFLSFLPILFYYVKTHLWMIMMESRIVMFENIVLLKILTTFAWLFFMGIKIQGKKSL